VFVEQQATDFDKAIEIALTHLLGMQLVNLTLIVKSDAEYTHGL